MALKTNSEVFLNGKHVKSTMLVIKLEYFFRTFMEYFLLWEIFRMSMVFTTMYAESTSLFLAYIHKIR